jgi:hypothetical protein
MLAVQAQDERGFRLAVRSRSDGLTVDDVDRELNDRRMVVTWLNRGTLHLVRSDDYWWLHPLTAPRSAATISHGLRELGISRGQADRGIDEVVRALETEGPLIRSELRERVDAVRVPTGGQALIYLLAAASLRGLIVRGPMLKGGHAFVAVRQWLGAEPPRLSRQESLARLLTRYLEGHGPAGPEDLSRWSGITLGDARSAFDEVSGSLRKVDVLLVGRDAGLGRSPSTPTRLLGAFDPILHGWSSREMWVGDHQSVVTTNGIFRPIVLSGGRTRGTWRFVNRRIEVNLLEPVADEAMSELVEDACDVYRFLGWDVPSDVITLGVRT